MHLGLIGGMGPAATARYYRGLCDGAAERGIPLSLTIAHADNAGSVARIEAGELDAQADVFAGHARQLQAAGAEVLVVTALSVHAMLDRIEARSPLPVCSVLTAIASHVAATGVQRVGVIGSAAAMESAVIGALGDREAMIPEPDARARVSDAYFAMAASGRCTAEQRALFHDAAGALVAAGAEAVLLGGTDLFLAFEGTDPGYPVIDVADVHVAALLDVAAI